jgi:hypothetical protein
MLCLAQARADGVQPCSRLWESYCFLSGVCALRNQRARRTAADSKLANARDDDALNLATMRLRPKSVLAAVRH